MGLALLQPLQVSALQNVSKEKGNEFYPFPFED